jgi:hypothetical protein
MDEMTPERWNEISGLEHALQAPTVNPEREVWHLAQAEHHAILAHHAHWSGDLDEMARHSERHDWHRLEAARHGAGTMPLSSYGGEQGKRNVVRRLGQQYGERWAGPVGRIPITPPHLPEAEKQRARRDWERKQKGE